LPNLQQEAGKHTTMKRVLNAFLDCKKTALAHCDTKSLNRKGRTMKMQRIVLMGLIAVVYGELRAGSVAQLSYSDQQITATNGKSTLNLSGLELDSLEGLLTITGIKDLQILNLSRNQLSRLPDSIWTLTNLKKLYLSTNRLITLPKGISKLTQLEELDLSANELIALPKEIGTLAKLTYLALNYNELSALPESIGQLADLNTLNLNHNELIKLPDSISKLTKLEQLTLNNNKLSALPKSIDQLADLKQLYLGDNKFTTLPEGILKLANLKELYLSDNKLTTLPEEISELNKLTILDLYGNEISQLPKSISQLTNLKDLVLSDNKLSRKEIIKIKGYFKGNGLVLGTQRGQPILSGEPGRFVTIGRFSTNRLAILLDVYEGQARKESQAITPQVLNLITQKTCPILMTSALWERFVWGRQLVDDVQKLSKEDLDAKYSVLRKMLLVGPYIRYIDLLKERNPSATIDSRDEPFLEDWVRIALQASKMNFIQDEWVYGTTSKDFVLLIPKKYQETMGEKLGLKIDTTDRYASTLKEGFSPPGIGEPSNLGTKLLTDFASLFTLPASDDQHWAIYLSGHGAAESIHGEAMTAEMTIPEFKKLLTYFSEKLPVSVFAYLSCFSAGSNLSKTYNSDAQTNFAEKHPFVIATAGISESAAFVPMSLVGNTNITKFFEICEKGGNETIDWGEALATLFGSRNFPKENAPLIKFPGTEWFNVPNIKDVALSIGKVLAATREKSLPLQDQKLILLYAPDIPFTLEYSKSPSSNKPPIPVSMIPGDACHTFAEISAESYEAGSILQSFFSYPDIPNEKAFFIKTLLAKNDFEKEHIDKPATLSNVLCIHRTGMKEDALTSLGFQNPSSGNNIVCFTCNGKAYGWLSSENYKHPKLKAINPNYADVVLEYLKKYAPSEESFTPEKKEPLKEILKKKQRMGPKYDITHAQASKKNLRVAKNQAVKEQVGPTPAMKQCPL